MAGVVEKIYCDALFDIASEDNSLKEVNEELLEISGICKDNPDLVKLLSAPTLSVPEKIKILEEIFKSGISTTVFNFLCLITEKGRFSYINKIAEEFKRKYNDYFGIVEITATTSIPLKETLRGKLILKLEAITSKKVVLIEKIDPSIIGGIVINYGNTQLNASVKSRLDAMRENIKSIIA